MIYIVSGWIRHGTSMMMHCLEAGGMKAAYDRERDSRMNSRLGDEHYQPNPDGFMELSAEQYKSGDFPKAYEGMVVKCLRSGPLRLPAGDYMVIYMRRDGEETRQSAQAIFSTSFPEEFAETVNRETSIISGILKQRRDCQVKEVWYRSLVDEDPLPIFEDLAEGGWPIEPSLAATVVDPKKCRFKIEDLEIGV
jgi:hypothetical protein